MITPEQYVEIFKHIATLNEEMGIVQANVEWLTWMMRNIFVGILLSFVTTVSLVGWNIFLTKRNGKK